EVVDDRGSVLVDRHRLRPGGAEVGFAIGLGQTGAGSSLEHKGPIGGKAERVERLDVTATGRQAVRLYEHRYPAKDAIGVVGDVGGTEYNALVGLLAGGLFGLVLISALELLDRRLIDHILLDQLARARV